MFDLVLWMISHADSVLLSTYSEKIHLYLHFLTLNSLADNVSEVSDSQALIDLLKYNSGRIRYARQVN